MRMVYASAPSLRIGGGGKDAALRTVARASSSSRALPLDWLTRTNRSAPPGPMANLTVVLPRWPAFGFLRASADQTFELLLPASGFFGCPCVREIEGLS